MLILCRQVRNENGHAVSYRISLHISRTFKVSFQAYNKGCDLYEGWEYNVSQWTANSEYYAKIMGATYMQV